MLPVGVTRAVEAAETGGKEAEMQTVPGATGTVRRPDANPVRHRLKEWEEIGR